MTRFCTAVAATMLTQMLLQPPAQADTPILSAGPTESRSDPISPPTACWPACDPDDNRRNQRSEYRVCCPGS